LLKRDKLWRFMEVKRLRWNFKKNAITLDGKVVKTEPRGPVFLGSYFPDGSLHKGLMDPPGDEIPGISADDAISIKGSNAYMLSRRKVTIVNNSDTIMPRIEVCQAIQFYKILDED
jgi:hypothetical protein